MKPQGYLLIFIYLAVSMVTMHKDLITGYQGVMLIGLGLLLAITNSILDHVEDIKKKVGEWKTNY